MIPRLLLAGLMAMALAWPQLLQAAGERLVVISDLNGRYGSIGYNPRVQRAVARIIELQPDAVLVAGDLVAGQVRPPLPDEHLKRMWQAFDETVGNPLQQAGIPLLVSPGNHDGARQPGFEHERRQFEEYWQARQPELPFIKGSHWPWHYGVRLGSLVVLSADGSNIGPLAEADSQFLEQALATEQAGNTLLMLHLPLWPFTQGRQTEIINDPWLRKRLADSGELLVVSGHHHAFFQGRDEAGNLHLASGPLGGNIRRLVGSRQRQAFSLAVLDHCDNGWQLTPLAAPDFDALLDTSGSPGTIEADYGRLQQAGLPAANLAQVCESGGD